MRPLPLSCSSNSVMRPRGAVALIEDVGQVVLEAFVVEIALDQDALDRFLEMGLELDGDEGLQDPQRLDPDEAVRALAPQVGVVLLVVSFDLEDGRVAEEAPDIGRDGVLVLLPQDPLAVLVELGDHPLAVGLEKVLALPRRGGRKLGSSLMTRRGRGGVLAELPVEQLGELREELVDLRLLGLVEAVGLALFEKAEDVLLEGGGKGERLRQVIEVGQLREDLLAGDEARSRACSAGSSILALGSKSPMMRS